MSDEKKDEMMQAGVSRRSVLGMGSAALAAAAFGGLSAHAQTREGTHQAEGDHSSSNPGQENKPLLKQNPNSNIPPPTDNGDVGPIWYSYDLTHKRIQEGGWTHQVTQRELPSSTDLAGVNMRLTSGSFGARRMRVPPGLRSRYVLGRQYVPSLGMGGAYASGSVVEELRTGGERSH